MNDRLARRRTSAGMLSGALMMLVCRGALAQQSVDPPSRLWAGIGLGYGYIQAAPPAPTGAGGVWLETQLGLQVGPHWLAGFELGGLGTRISRDNYNPNDSGSSIFGQSVTHELLILEYASRFDRGGSPARASGACATTTGSVSPSCGSTRSAAMAPAALGRLGYDWRVGRRTHVGVDLSYERGDVRLNAPLTGRFEVSMIGTDFHVAYR